MASSGTLRDEHGRLLRRDCPNTSYGSVEVGQEKTPDNYEENENASPVGASTPLPLKQLLVVVFMRLAEPIAYSQIFPYINEMMEDIGAIDDARMAGYYSGVMESSFAIAELLTVMRWGSLSDRIGRKPVLLLGFFGAMLSTLLFGLSKSFLWALITRCLAGGLSGNVAVLLSAVGDMTDETNEARAYAIYGIAYNIAQMAGPSIGGAFADPAVTFSDSLGTFRLFQVFPFLLPCVISALVTLISALFCAAFFEETHHREPVKPTSEPAEPLKTEEPSSWNLATAPPMLSVLKPFFLLCVLNTSLYALFSLFAYTPISYGGLSRNPEEIGFAIASAGLIGAIIQAIILPELQLRFGTIPLYRFFMSLWLLIYLMFPVLNGIARHTTDEDVYSAHSEGIAVWTGIGILLSLNRLASMAFSLNLILTKSASPSISVLGKVFALSQSVSCIARVVAPSFVSSLFAFSKESDVLGGNLVWAVMCTISALGVWVTCNVRDKSMERHMQR